MDERRWERMGAAYGVAFGILLLASLFTAPVPPHIDESVSTISAYYSENQTRIMTAQMLGALAVIPFLLFVGHLRHVMDRSERGTEAIAPIVLLSGATLAGIALAALIPSSLLAVMAGQGELGEAGIVRTLFDSSFLATGPIGMVGALFLGAVGYAMVKGELVEPWLGYVGLAMAALFLVTGVWAFYLEGHSAVWMSLNIVAGVGFALFTVAAGAMMLMHPEQERVAERMPLLSPTSV